MDTVGQVDAPPTTFDGAWAAVRAKSTTSVTELILGRRSVRDGFCDRSIPRHILTEIVECGLAAPSSKNAQPWKLHVVTARQMLADIASAAANSPDAATYVPRDPATGQPRPWDSTVCESAEVLRFAAAAIFVENRGAFSSGRRVLASAPPLRFAGSLVGYTFEVLGVGAAIQNMLIAAQALGVQGTYMGDIVIAEEFIAKRLSIEVDLVGVLALGYSAEVPPPRVHDSSDPDHVVWHD